MITSIYQERFTYDFRWCGKPQYRRHLSFPKNGNVTKNISRPSTGAVNIDTKGTSDYSLKYLKFK